MQFSFVVTLAMACLPFITANPTLSARGCDDNSVSTSYIGANKNVKVDYHGCSGATPAPSAVDSLHAEAGDYPDVCDAPCNTDCETPAGNGPEVNDCQVIADALLYEQQNGDVFFYANTTTPTSTNYVVMTYNTCSTTFVNQAATPISYCNQDWAGVIEWVAPQCSTSANAHGGICLAQDQSWFIEVKHS